MLVQHDISASMHRFLPSSPSEEGDPFCNEGFVFNPYNTTGNYIDLYGASSIPLTCQMVHGEYQTSVEEETLGYLKYLYSPVCCISELEFVPKNNSQILEFWQNIWKQVDVDDGVTILRGSLCWVSIIASSIFIWMIFRSYDGITTVQNRLLLGLCVGDMIYSFGNSLFGSMLPKEVKYVAQNASGSMATCQMIGFIDVFGSVCGPYYNASLCLYYLFIVKYEKSEEYLRTKVEPFLHALPLIAATTTAIFFLLIEGYNPQPGGICLGPYTNMPHCWGAGDESTIKGLFEIPCGRGAKDFITKGKVFLLSEIACPPIIMFVSLAAIYRTVRNTEKKIDKFKFRASRPKATTASSQSSPDGRSSILARMRSSIGSGLERFYESQQSQPKHPKSRAVMHKAMAYSFSWLISWIWIILHFFVRSHNSFILYAGVTFLPLQGVYNLAIFMFPKVIGAKKSKREKLSWRQAFVKAFWSKGGRNNRRTRRCSAPQAPLRDTRTNHRGANRVLTHKDGIGMYPLDLPGNSSRGNDRHTFKSITFGGIKNSDQNVVTDAANDDIEFDNNTEVGTSTETIGDGRRLGVETDGDESYKPFISVTDDIEAEDCSTATASFNKDDNTNSGARIESNGDIRELGREKSDVNDTDTNLNVHRSCDKNDNCGESTRNDGDSKSDEEACTDNETVSPEKILDV
jgi:hypothetical protein